ncbi:MAG: hypothetical protein EZS28_005255 [Streblomastix strix]|uniref:General stress protein FMN-binding split barrel domain-containing protein n=1 Tax=Streblomastix strix TaxID=222440 RepID=A0A5J4WWA1_9EUKA|nr:MAG: hypothetical protein EZS28_005255 [Streblomastix strix]
MANAAEKFLLNYQEHFLWSVLTTTNNTRPSPRVGQLRHSSDLGFFYTTKTGTSKIAQIEKNPLATISLYPKKGFDTIVAHVSLRLSAERRDLDAAWSDELLQYGYTGKNDERLRVILITVHQVTFGKDSYEGTPIDPKIEGKISKGESQSIATGPFKTKEIDELLKKTFTPKKLADLITFQGSYHDSRVMEVHYKEGVGLFSSTHLGSKKVNEIQVNENVALLVSDQKAWDQIIVDAVAKICTCPEMKKKVWEDSLKAFGFKGADDEQLTLIIYTPRRTIHHTMVAPPEELVAEPIPSK